MYHGNKCFPVSGKGKRGLSPTAREGEWLPKSNHFVSGKQETGEKRRKRCASLTKS